MSYDQISNQAEITDFYRLPWEARFAQGIQFIVSPAVYPRLVVNYDLRPLTQKPSLQNFRGSPEFPNQNLRQIGHGVCSDIQTKRETEISDWNKEMLIY